jgi:putative membrane protein
MMDWNDGAAGWGWAGWFMMITMMLVAVGLVAWGVLTVSRATRRPDADTNVRSPEEVLADRFARGEVDKDEYEQRRNVLRGKAGTKT